MIRWIPLAGKFEVLEDKINYIGEIKQLEDGKEYVSIGYLGSNINFSEGVIKCTVKFHNI